jgi:hypothetical protein
VGKLAEIRDKVWVDAGQQGALYDVLLGDFVETVLHFSQALNYIYFNKIMCNNQNAFFFNILKTRPDGR